MTNAINPDDYTYDLPEERIAKYPVSPRDGSKLLHYHKGRISDRIFSELPDILQENTLLVFNDTRVVQARLKFEKKTGSRIEIFCLEPHEPADYSIAFQKSSDSVWKCLVGNARKWKSGKLQMDIQVKGKQLRLMAEKTGREKDAFLVRFKWDPAEMVFSDILENAGKTPIPPYLNREAEHSDKTTYQTVYSRIDGSVAAPTAGLHFTERVLAEIAKRGIPSMQLTLHVGAGTFQPVIARDIGGHSMHAEHFYIDRDALETLLRHRGNILAVGTTSTRVLETIYRLGIRLAQRNPAVSPPFFLDQWDAYVLAEQERYRSLESLLGYMDKRHIDAIEGLTRLMIVPGYKFGMVDQLLTNYHQPRSTLLLLVAAFIGKDWRRVYDHALDNDFRFLSYGDSSLLIP